MNQNKKMLNEKKPSIEDHPLFGGWATPEDIKRFADRFGDKISNPPEPTKKSKLKRHEPGK